MERIISDEEKIRRAIEISQRRNNNYNTTTRVNVSEKKDYKLFKKMILQIIICLLIYIIFYLITSTNYVFSSQVIQKTNEVLNYDINFSEVYNNLISLLNPKKELNQPLEQMEQNYENTITQTNEQIIQNINSSVEGIIESNTLVQEQHENKEQQEIVEDEKLETKNKEEVSKTQMELDAEKVMDICEFQSPLKGTITSEFGGREATIKGMTTDHKGIDIAANSGTSIKAAMSGTVKVAEENSEYGKFIKIENNDVMTVYAHCKKLKVKVGDKIKKGQTIATVGSTGNSTGPHLHFEIRFENRYINPRYVIEF